MIWKRATSALIDILLIYCIGFLIHLVIIQLVFIDILVIIAVVWIFYYWVFYYNLQGRTLAKVITRLQVVSDHGKKLDGKQIFIREILGKFFVFFLMPGYLINHTSVYKSSQLTQVLTTAALFIIALGLITLTILMIYKRTWWELISSTKTIRNPIQLKSWRKTFCVIIVGVFMLTVFTKIYPLLAHGQIGITFYPKYPVNAETKRYAEFINTHSQDPVEYVYSLFDQYDLVVLCERLHPETTQYELISRIISDKRFPAKIGNIFTELGSTSFQDTVNTYLKTVFPNEEELNQATSFLQRNSDGLHPLWECTNRFDFLKGVNLQNASLPDSLKIRWHFADIPMNWETMTPENYRKIPRGENRDKIMAENVVRIYRNLILSGEKRKKSLIIMNFRHGYGLIKDRNGRKADHVFNTLNTTAFLMDSLPGKVGNVFINTIRLGPLGFDILAKPLQQGKWDMAFSLAGNPAAGFNFSGSPFGEDSFDAFLGNPAKGIKYQDVFTGFIFYKPLEQHRKQTGFPYMLSDFKDTLIRRAECVSESLSESWKNSFRFYENNHTIAEDVPYAFTFNLIDNIGFSVLICLTMILCLSSYSRKQQE